MYICFGFRHAKCLWKQTKQENKKNENNVSFRSIECQWKIALDWIKQVRKTLFKTIATKERHCCNSWGWTGGIRNIAQIKLNSTENKGRRVFKHLSELVGKYRKTLVGRLEFFFLFFSSVQFSRSVVSNSLQTHELQHARPPCPSPTPRAYSVSCPSSRWCHPSISSYSVPFPPAPNPSQHQGLFQWVNSSHEVAKVLEFQL